MFKRLQWSRHSANWPNHEASQFVEAAGIEWHVQIMGEGPVLLLLHGTGASSHSWRDFLPDLAKDFTVIAPDLPGHGFTQSPDSPLFTLPGMAQGIGALLDEIGLTPSYAVGHSAGAAVLCQMSLDELLRPKSILSFNGALLPIPGVAGPIAGNFARAMTWNPAVPVMVAWRAGKPETISGLLDGMGSSIDDEGVRLYATLAGSPQHARAALCMMASWDLDTFERRLPSLATPIALVVGEKDQFITEETADRVVGLVPGATKTCVPGVGHLAHEEQPEEFLEIIRKTFR